MSLFVALGDPHKDGAFHLPMWSAMTPVIACSDSVVAIYTGPIF